MQKLHPSKCENCIFYKYICFSGFHTDFSYCIPSILTKKWTFFFISFVNLVYTIFNIVLLAKKSDTQKIFRFKISATYNHFPERPFWRRLSFWLFYYIIANFLQPNRNQLWSLDPKQLLLVNKNFFNGKDASHIRISIFTSKLEFYLCSTTQTTRSFPKVIMGKWLLFQYLTFHRPRAGYLLYFLSYWVSNKFL